MKRAVIALVILNVAFIGFDVYMKHLLSVPSQHMIVIKVRSRLVCQKYGEWTVCKYQ
jgi:hypothetical protein